MSQGCREGFPLSDFFSSSTAKGSIFGDGSLDWEAYTAWCKDLYALRHAPEPPSSLVYDKEAYGSATNIVVSKIIQASSNAGVQARRAQSCIAFEPTTSNLYALVKRAQAVTVHAV